MRSVSWVVSLAWASVALRSCHQVTTSSRWVIMPTRRSLSTEGIPSVDTPADGAGSTRFLRGVAMGVSPKQECIHDVHLHTQKYIIGVHRCTRVVRSGCR